MELGGLWWTNVLNSALPPQRHRPDSQLEQQDPVSYTAQKKREIKKKERGGEREREREGERKKRRNKIKLLK